MTLTHERLAEAVTCMRCQPDRLDHERRVLPRFRIWAPVVVTPITQAAHGPVTGTPFTVWVRDLSRGGIGLMHTARLAHGFEFLVPLPRLDGDDETLIANVVYCGTAAPEMFSVGARFTGRFPLATAGTAAMAVK